MRSKLAGLFLLLLIVIVPATGWAQTIRVVVEAEFGIPTSTSAQAIFNGARVAADEINDAGGVLGRKLEIVRSDNRGIPARALNNLRKLATDPDVVAVLCGKYSPLVVEMLPEIHRQKILLLDPWAAADSITENGYAPNFVFRLSLRDTWAMEAMTAEARRDGLRRLGLLLPNTEWGRSSQEAAERKLERKAAQKIVATEWYHWGDTSLAEQYRRLLEAGAEAVIMVANEREGSIFVNEMAALPASERRPVLAHWGITGGQFFETAGAALTKVDLRVVQTVTLIGRTDEPARKVLAGLQRLGENSDPRRVAAPVGVAHAYDLVHLLARAITRAGSSRREAVRDALERLGPYQGVVRHFERPFTPERHDALSRDDVFMARYAEDGAITRLAPALR